MSSSIWTQCAGDSELRPLRLTPWRAVEAQHLNSTRKLVRSVEEQHLLEDLLEAAKPPAAAPPKLHYLLATPFRYPPLRHGSRFGARHEPSLWYGAESLGTVFAEVAYYRFVFLEGTSAELGTVSTALTAFRVSARSAKAVDLTLPPFDAHRGRIASPTRYDASQALGAAMRAAGVELFRYPSARDPEGVGVALFTPRAFGAAKPRDEATWHCVATRERVELARRDHSRVREAMRFERARFLVRGALPLPAL